MYLTRREFYQVFSSSHVTVWLGVIGGIFFLPVTWFSSYYHEEHIIYGWSSIWILTNYNLLQGLIGHVVKTHRSLHTDCKQNFVFVYSICLFSSSTDSFFHWFLVLWLYPKYGLLKITTLDRPLNFYIIVHFPLISFRYVALVFNPDFIQL